MAGRRVLEKLSVEEGERARPGTHVDGGGLHLLVEKTGARRGAMRLSINGRRVHRGLGEDPATSLAEARKKAHAIREAAKEGRDISIRVSRRRQGGITFRDAFQEMVELRRLKLLNGKPVAQRETTMREYMFPVIGDMVSISERM